MDIILIAGLWLPESIWSEVSAELEKLGHTSLPVALPGVDDGTSAATLDDQVAAAVSAVDAAGKTHGRGTLRGLHAGLDCRRPTAGVDRPRVMIGGFPATNDGAYADFFEAVQGVMPFPGWDPFEGPDGADLDEDTRTRIAEKAAPVPEGVSKGAVRLTDERRFAISVVLVCPEFNPEDARGWIESGEVPELEKVQSLSYVDIDSGHWPMVTRPAELARILDAAASHRIDG